MTQFDVGNALVNHMVEYVEEFPVDVLYPGGIYEPILGTPYIRMDIVYGTPSSVGIGLNTKNRIPGFVQFVIRTPSKQGNAITKGITETLHEKWKRGTSISFDGVNVRIIRFSVFEAIPASDWDSQIIRIQFRADIEN